MGVAISAIQDFKDVSDEEQNKEQQAAAEQINILEKMVNARLETAMHNIINGEKNDEQIHSGTIVELQKKVYIVQNKGANSKIKDSIGDFFSGNIKQGFEDLIMFGAEAVLENDRAGEFETTDMFITWSSNALLRCDTYYYRWNFSVSGVMAKAEGVSGVLLVKRVIDLTKTDPQVLTWAITEQMTSRKSQDEHEASQSDIIKEIDSALAVLKKTVAFQVELKQVETKGAVKPALKQS